MTKSGILQELKGRFSRLVEEHGLSPQKIMVKVGTLSAREAIGNPSRNDYPILEGKEVMIQAEFQGSFGQAFTDHPRDFQGTVSDLLNLDLSNSGNRAVFVASVNAIASHLELCTGMRHCRDEEPEKCAAMIAAQLYQDFGKVKIGLIGLQPAILEHLAVRFGVENVHCSDLNPKNVGSIKSGITILNGRTDNLELVKWADVILITSSAIVNDSIDIIREEALKSGKAFIIFGVSGAGAAALLNMRRMCYFGH